MTAPGLQGHQRELMLELPGVSALAIQLPFVVATLDSLNVALLIIDASRAQVSVDSRRAPQAPTAEALKSYIVIDQLYYYLSYKLPA
ncbi:hypothetical protein ACIPY1_18990 [Paenarthrobacter nicotinovorans]|uniref:hypothetical protein n=1 Tax=Paenarthrobacter nicotinovorans TaxID=29320 RepID=UPI0038184B31